METKIIPLGSGKKSLEQCIQERTALRTINADGFIEQHASGTLRKNKRLGMCWKQQYLSERVAYEFGWEFECQPRSRVMFGDAYTEGDNKAITEAGWHMERYMNLSLFPEDRYEVKYISVEYPEGERKEGLGMIVRETSAPWIPPGHVVYAIVAAYDPVKEQWHEAKNPF